MRFSRDSSAFSFSDDPKGIIGRYKFCNTATKVYHDMKEKAIGKRKIENQKEEKRK